MRFHSQAFEDFMMWPGKMLSALCEKSRFTPSHLKFVLFDVKELTALNQLVKVEPLTICVEPTLVAETF